jgi:hypothetical protein
MLGPPNLVERNLVWHTIDNGIQIVGQVTVRNNIVVDAGLYGIQSKASQGFQPNDAIIVNNTVVAGATACLKINDWGATTGGLVANNALYCEGGTAVDAVGGVPGAMFLQNVVRGSVRGVMGGFSTGGTVEEDLGPEAMLARVYPTATSALLEAGAPDMLPPDDFDGTLRVDGMPDVGAYERTAAGVGWLVVEGFKQERGAPGVDAGMGPGVDAGGMPGPDGGPPGSDLDAAVTPPGGGEEDGCGCVAAGATPRAGAGAVGVVLSAGWWVRRRLRPRDRRRPR